MTVSRNGIFITGTDTGVGKTYVACGIARGLRRRGVNVGVMKPAETGCIRRRGILIPSDAIRLMKAAVVRDALHRVNPYRFADPLAPSIAAEFAGGKRINPSKIRESFRMLSRRHDFTIVEGAGGIMVPLVKDYLFLDLAEDLRLPVLIVARPGLGTINHTLLSISAIRTRRMRIAGVVINYAMSDWKTGLAEKTSPHAIEMAAGVSILGTLQYGESQFDNIIDGLTKLYRSP